MQSKPLVQDRPRLDLALRVLVWAVVVVLSVAAIVTGDARQLVAVVALASFAATQTLVLPPRTLRVVDAVAWVAIVGWLALLIA